MNPRLATWTIACSAIVASSGIVPMIYAGPPAKPPGEEVKVEIDVFPKEAPGPDKPVHNPPSLEKQVNALIAAYDLKPRPPEAFPDNPPPHEGAMIDIPQVIDAPDLVVIEVLDAMPGRPISGERLVRPDGNVDLGFYGQVHLRGLTLEQAKVKVIKHLRAFITDEVLGLAVPPFEESDAMEEGGKGPDDGLEPKDPEPNSPPASNPSKPDPEKPPTQTPKKASDPARTIRKKRPKAVFDTRPSRFDQTRARSVATRPSPARAILTARQDPEPQHVARLQEKKGLEIPIGGDTKLTITIDVQQGEAKGEEQAVIGSESDGGPMQVIPPAKSDRVFVDIAAYNSRYYYVHGDVAVPGRLPCTGNETVLDALNFSGGFIPTADRKNFRLVRPARGKEPARIYPIDIDAILERGDPKANLQILPGDRLVIGRSVLVQKTIDLDRIAAPLQTILSSILHDSYVLRSIQSLDPEKRDAVMKEFLEFWSKQLSTTGDVTLDEKTLREALIRKLSPAPPPEKK